ncbi:Inherit from euNOG: Violaxanthin [Seminavis robusta]|uniref:Inherit from euNOG: Violaxanthin n=1 Tax=Seminavis robusta TaxID=568900 RepID=A0A9N8E411_9STRA|nr:Inherit from euNOG: Violaxanthin [Seminavis robusta]|eukprot:Sro521_g159480.1 Inherit from euNOG: Violaxanthin (506) ;mRNA; f:54442-56056
MGYISKKRVAASALLLTSVALPGNAFTPSSISRASVARPISPMETSNHIVQRPASSVQLEAAKGGILGQGKAVLTGVLAGALLSASLAFSSPAFAENELSDKYGGGFDSSLVDQTCLVDKCSVQAKACLADDPSCRKGLTCTAKCLGDNACITGCMARYGDRNLDNLLKCTIEDNECIKIAILPGGADKFNEAPRSPAPTIPNFNTKSLEGSWYKVVGYNPNYDCYACQRNTFSPVDGDNMFTSSNKLQMDVEFSMPHLLPDGSPLPPKNVRETIQMNEADGEMLGSMSIGMNAYSTHETMVFDKNPNPIDNFVSKKGVGYSRTAHSEGEMFGLKFWENWYVIGENDPSEPEFKFVYYNGKTRQNTYEGAFIYSRSRELDPVSMKKVYKIAKDAGMNPDNFCSIRNGCFKDEDNAAGRAPTDPFRGFLASTKVSELLGVEPVAARDTVMRGAPTAEVLNPDKTQEKRAWYYEVGDYLENPHRHFQAMDNLRVKMVWPEEVTAEKN